MNSQINKDYSNEEIEIKELFLIIWRNYFFILLFTSLSALGSLFYSLSLPNIYTSSAILSPQQGNDSISNNLGNYASLAGLVGVSLPQGESSDTIEAMERIKSLNFFKNDFLPFIQLENLMAVEKWSSTYNSIEYIDTDFDMENGLWVRDVSHPKSKIPSFQESHKRYRQLLSVSQDKNSNFVTITIKHESPHIAKKWVEIIISNINNLMKKEEKIKSENAIKFLNEASDKNNLADISRVFNELLKSETQKLMLISSSNNFIFKTIEPPFAPEIKSSPRRSLICIFGTIIGFILSVFFTLFYTFFMKR
jgi:capsular polysaccharide biosynthesis protein